MKKELSAIVVALICSAVHAQSHTVLIVQDVPDYQQLKEATPVAVFELVNPAQCVGLNDGSILLLNDIIIYEKHYSAEKLSGDDHRPVLAAMIRGPTDSST